MNKDLAEKLLSLNTHNRNLRLQVVEAYAEDMAAKPQRWLETGDTIKVSTDSVLIDGQHRIAGFLRACAIHEALRPDAGPLTIPMWIAWDLDPDVQDATDAGAKRQLKDALRLRKPPEHNPIALAAILRLVNAWQVEENKRTLGQRTTATTATLLAVFKRHPELRDITTQAVYDSLHTPFSASVLGLTRWVLSRIDADDAEKFFELLRTQEGQGKGDPIYELRRAGQRERDNQSHRRQAKAVALIFKAWNMWRQGLRLNENTGLSFKMGGATPERFPEPM